MAESKDGANPSIKELLEEICKIDLNELDPADEPSEESGELTDRGPPCREGSQKDKIHELLILNRRRRNLVEKIDGIKNFMKQNDELNGLVTLGKFLNEEMLDPHQRRAFLREFEQCNKDEEMLDPHQRRAFLREFEQCNKEQEAPILPTGNDLYLCYKGIHYTRILMTKYHSVSDNAILRELKSKNLLNVVFTERIDNEKNYIMILADTFPRSFDEIKFIIHEEKDVILNSSIFVNIAERNLQYLYELLLMLLNIVDESELSRACQKSYDHGLTVSIILQQLHPPEMMVYAGKIERFLNRNRQNYGH